MGEAAAGALKGDLLSDLPKRRKCERRKVTCDDFVGKLGDQTKDGGPQLAKKLLKKKEWERTRTQMITLDADKKRDEHGRGATQGTAFASFASERVKKIELQTSLHPSLKGGAADAEKRLTRSWENRPNWLEKRHAEKELSMTKRQNQNPGRRWGWGFGNTGPPKEANQKAKRISRKP